MINRETWGRMEYMEHFNILTYRLMLRFERAVAGMRRHVDGEISVPLSSAVALRCARVVWADRAEVAFDLEVQASGIHQPSAAFIDYPHDWRRDAARVGKPAAPHQEQS